MQDTIFWIAAGIVIPSAVGSLACVVLFGVRPEYALIDLTSGKPFGQASYLNIEPVAGSIEVGGIV